MIDGPLDYPFVVVTALKPILAALPGVEAVFMRETRQTDPDTSIGFYPLDWMPTEYEIGRWDEPSIGVYHYMVESFIKHGDADEGAQVSAELSTLIRRTLQRSDEVIAALGALNVASGYTERVLKWNVTRQTFAQDETGTTFRFASATLFDVHTELL